MDATDYKMDLSLPRRQSLIQNIHWKKEDVENLSEALVKRFKWQNLQTGLMDTWMAKILHTIEIHQIDLDLTFGSDGCNVIELVNNNDIDDDNLLSILGEAREKSLEEILEDLSEHGVDLHLIDKVNTIVSNVTNQKPFLKGSMESYLFDLCKQVSEVKKLNPRIIQMVSWCLLALSESSYLLQVRTGEGKSCIVAMFAAYRALKGQKVDIISSSPVLAQRDAEAWKPFYEKLGLKVNHNTSTSDEEDLKQCYKCDIVYGTTDNFAGDWLQHHFMRKKVRGDRQFHCVIVDEVDSLMLDKGLEMVYLSSKMPAMQDLNIILSRIWLLVSQHEKLNCGKTAGPIQPFINFLQENSDISSEMNTLNILKVAEDKGIFPKGFSEDMKHLNAENVIQKLECVDKTVIIDFFRLAEETNPNYCFRLFSEEEDGTLKKLIRIEDGEVGDRQEIPLLFLKGGLMRYLFSDRQTLFNWVEQKIRKDLQFTSPDVTPENSPIIGFQHLIYDKLRVWVENAFRATEMDLGDEYIIQADTVVPVDYQCTGVIQSNMKWGDGLQQFLEMKHQTKVSNMTVITNFMSNVRLFKMYERQVFGVTGTLGNKEEIEMLQELYNGMHTCTMPSFKRRKLFEEVGNILSEEGEWLKAICSAVKEKVKSTHYRGERAVLVICETINRALTIEKAIKELDQEVNLKTYTKNSDSREVTENPIQARDVIVATNLAGRGTDLQVCKEVNMAGGLFVLQTFLPLNTRVEQQAFGRTGRQGNPGSAQMIMCVSHLSMSVIVKIITNVVPIEALKPVCTDGSDNKSSQQIAIAIDDLLSYLNTPGKSNISAAKEARDSVVGERLSSYLKRDIPKMATREDLFFDYLQLLDEMHEENKNSKMLSEIVKSMHECWGLWLLTRFDENESKETLKVKFDEVMGSARKHLEKWRSPSSAVSFNIRCGNALRLEGHFSMSIEMYSLALEADDEDFIALYNRALSVMQQQEIGYVSVALRDLEKAGKSVEHAITLTEETLTNVVITGPNPLAGNITGFTKQLCTRLQVLKHLKLNINEAVNKLMVAHNMGGGVKVTQCHVFFLLGIESLLQDVIKDFVNELGNLQSLGLTHIFSLNTTFSLAGFFSKLFRDI
ncbi:protein translocase subunit SecA-like [Sardina pilchardus]|uniref:protein translocase subunit SecA-like n=1 Tax=Sardina pilchardus TaxID=27697 RepID=UPI002E15D996